MIWLWCARFTWALLPVSVGTALDDAISSWSTAPARVAIVDTTPITMPKPTSRLFFMPAIVTASRKTSRERGGGQLAGHALIAILRAQFDQQIPRLRKWLDTLHRTVRHVGSALPFAIDDGRVGAL